jgi:hypothetical protein
MPTKTKKLGVSRPSDSKNSLPTALIMTEPSPAGQGKTPAPEWLLETPMPTHYTLTMWDEEGGNEQDVLLNRREFIALKRRLAEMRGYDLPDVIPDFYGRLAPEGQ